MTKKRVHELAKELNIENKELINKLMQIGISVKSHMSALENDAVEKVYHQYGKKQEKSSDSANKQIQREHGRGQGMEDKKEKDQLFRPDNAKGPGLVDRVPNRPPDRRYEDKAKVAQKPAQELRGSKTTTNSENEQTAPRQGSAQQSGQGRPQANRPQGSQGRPYGGRPQGGQSRPYGDRPQGGQGRPYGDRPQGGQGRPYGDRPQGGQGRPYGDRPQGGQGRPYGDRPQGGQGRPYGDRPQGGQGRPYGDRPQGGQSRPYGDRPQGGQGRPYGDRPQGGQSRPYGDRPQGGQGRPYGDRPQGGQGRHYGDRPQGGQGRPQGAGRPGANRGAGPSIPKPPEQVAQPKPTKAPDKTKGDRRKNYEKDGKWADGQIEKNKLFKGRNNKNKKRQHQQSAPPPILDKKPVQIAEVITVQELAEKLKKTAAEVIKKLMGLGVLATINQEVDFETATLIAGEYGIETELKVAVDKEALVMAEPEEDEDKLVLRPPVVTIMGHVDHGKTSLLDAIRETNVTAGEAGGITQHIGAYQVERNGKKITFVDTPGHAAFTSMRARGAQITDIAILVVAADDGVMPQTIEAINHAKAANVPIIVAINKMDKPDANPDKVKQELTQHELVVEDWGGDVIAVPVSAKNRTGLDNLLEMILLVAEVHELKANPDRMARGTVVEAELDKGRGPVATVLVQNGTLNVGDTIVVGQVSGRVRAMIDDKGRRVKKAPPSTPVEILGLSDVPEAGDILVAVEDEKLARDVAEKRKIRKREEGLKSSTKISLDDLFKHIQEGQIKELPIIVKADVQGSIEALAQALEKLTTEEVKVNLIHTGVGAVNETDIMLATASNAIVIGFNVRPDNNARKLADAEKVDINLYRVIYEVIDDVKKAMSGLLDPEFKEVVLGHVEVRKTFKASKIGTIAGGYVTEGKIVRDASVRVIRDGIVVFEGKLDSLKRFKDDAKEVAQGYECGLTIDRFNDVQEGDIIEAFTMEAIKREI
ncbi:bacterial translation initiation factor 2 (bIF-2) [Desulforamulus reducens MI-1]|uniref:Translation initiation factor IF-2 n=1 Tax=Desulforamulus reducens (strain ATCC BAA-1160 / DSM 100696 / MI-1) TaxID=349161 RepID=IF2_DESRM|nr:translation initiation factor IF-2 [Desulforamulus reducens]A4J5X2.1 RecName: Full=Translation initiation factor IF-2 [Desulforamulus reducens MI-1]ABO50475.1 bacterial translation initiation factor 2 (bIF-2) [Desulforamulus reducens MI-1]